MQLHVDTDTEPVAGLMLLSRLLIDYANMKAQHDKALKESYPASSQPAVLTVGPITSGQLEAGMKVTDAQGRDLGTLVGPEPDHADDDARMAVSHQPDPAVIFGKFPVPAGATPSNVVPLFPQPALNLPGATGPAALGLTQGAPAMGQSAPLGQTTIQPSALPVTTGAAAGETLPSVTNATANTQGTNAPSLPANNAAVSSAGVDSQGIPWDERIHSSSKKRKGDGTWILKRGLADGVAQIVTAELIAAKLPETTHGTALNAAPAAVPAPNTAVTGSVLAFNPTVPLPPGLQTSAVPMPPLAGSAPAHSAPVPVPVAPSVPGMPIPPTPAAGAVPVPPEVNPVKRFGAMMAKVSQALGAKTITQQQVLDAHVAVGLQQLQQAVLNPDKIPLIEAALGLA